MIINNYLDEVKKRENALRIIKDIVKNEGRDNLFDLTGLSGGFIASNEDLNLLETYVGPAIFEDELQELGINHMGGEKIFSLNRTSSGILATILSLVDENSNVIHYLPELPSHPSIPKSCDIVGANYLEFDNFEEFNIPENTSLVIITGATMDHKVIDEEKFKKVIDMAHKEDIPVLVDDASGARLRTVIFDQSKACDLGADIVITSTDKLMPGPRGGLMAGKKELIDKIKVKANQFGLEAQPPSILAMVNALKEFNDENLSKSYNRKHEFISILNKNFTEFELTPTGVMITPDRLAKQLNVDSDLSNNDIAFLFSMILLKEEGIITIPAVSMPGASPTIRFDLSTTDAFNLTLEILSKKILNSFDILKKVSKDDKKSSEIIFN